jgi:hypothetical protein
LDANWMITADADDADLHLTRFSAAINEWIFAE